MGTAADDVAIGCLEYSMEADFTKTGGFGRENGAEEIVQSAPLAFLFIYIVKGNATFSANDRGSWVFAFSHQGASQGLEG